jgi:putative toxin-antitoxin system antitoxin component (TIGR02293 family)
MMSNVPGQTPVDQLAGQLQHPSANSIWARALEVFGDEAKARSWMDAPRDIFGGRSPQDLVATGDAAEQRRVLEVLLRIDYGVFS